MIPMVQMANLRRTKRKNTPSTTSWGNGYDGQINQGYKDNSSTEYMINLNVNQQPAVYMNRNGALSVAGSTNTLIQPNPVYSQRIIYDPCSSDNDVNERRIKPLKDVIKSFASVTSMQGPPFMRRSKYWYSVAIWSFLFIAALIAATYQVYEIFDNYLSWPYDTQINLRNGLLEFPSVSICNLNPVREDWVEYTTPEFEAYMEELDADVDTQVRDPRDQMVTTEPFMPVQKRKKRQTQPDPTANSDSLYNGVEITSAYFSPQREKYEKFIRLYGNLSLSTRKEIGHQIEVMLRECSYAGRSCSAENFKYFPSPTYGNCYTFNVADPEYSNSSLVARGSGPNNGLELLLYLEKDQYLSGYSSSAGIMMTIHPYGTIAYPESTGFPVAPHEETYVGLRKVSVSRLGLPYEVCNTSELFQSMYKANYTEDGCYNTCIYDKVLELCNCYYAPYDNYYSDVAISTMKACQSDSDNECAKSTIDFYTSNSTFCNCHPACNSESYTTLISHAQWPDHSFFFTLINDVCSTSFDACDHLKGATGTEVGDSFVKVHLYYIELNYQEITQKESYDLFTFVSDIGGAIGLWVGFSILTAFELIHLCFELIRQIYRNNA